MIIKSQGSRVRPNFSRVRQIWGRTGASSHSRKKTKVSATQKVSLLFNNRHVRLISWSKPIRDSEGRTIGQTNRKWKKIRATCLGYTAQTIYLLGPEPRAALDHMTPLYTALGDTVKKVVEFTAESITSLSNLVRNIQIQHRIMLKLQTSEQTPLMWKPVETLFNKHNHHHSPWI